VSGVLAGGNFIGKTRLSRPAEKSSQLLSGVFDFTEMRNLFQQPAPTLLLDFDAGDLLQKLHLPTFQRIIFGVHAEPPTKKNEYTNPPMHPKLTQIRRFLLLTFLCCYRVLQKLTWALEVRTTLFCIARSRYPGDDHRDGGLVGLPAMSPPGTSPSMINRNALLIHARQPYLDWINASAADQPPIVDLKEVSPTLYLVPAFDDADEEARVLKQVYRDIFCRELEGWCRNVTRWPPKLTLPLFREWFEIQSIDLVEDVGHGPIENDEDPEEKHRFSPQPPPPPPRTPPPHRRPRH